RASSGPSVVPVFTDATTAAEAGAGGALVLSVGAGDPLPARVAGVLPRFPTTGPAFVVADARTVADALDAREPGTGAVRELWLSTADPSSLAAALAVSPYAELARVRTRQATVDLLASDPVAQGAADLLATSGLLCFAVALLALVLLVVAERRDEAPQLYTWEGDGVAPG